MDNGAASQISPLNWNQTLRTSVRQVSRGDTCDQRNILATIVEQLLEEFLGAGFTLGAAGVAGTEVSRVLIGRA